MEKQKYLRLAVIKTMVSGFFYLMMPPIAKLYHIYIGNDWVGYTILGSSLLILGNIILLIHSWALAFDSDLRKSAREED